MSYRVRVATVAREQVAARYGVERTGAGRPSRSDFERGRSRRRGCNSLAFDELPHEIGPSVGHCHVTAPGFPVIVFIGVLVSDDTVEIADFSDDPEYWNTMNSGQPD